MKLKPFVAAVAALAFGTQATAATSEQTITCVFEKPRATRLVDGEFTNTELGFMDTESAWVYEFTLDLTNTDEPPLPVRIRSEKDFATIAGDYQAYPVATETYLIYVLKSGGCMFSSQVCGASIQLTDLDSANATAAITPLSYFGDQKSAEFLHVVLLGKCTRDSQASEDDQ